MAAFITQVPKILIIMVEFNNNPHHQMVQMRTWLSSRGPIYGQMFDDTPISFESPYIELHILYQFPEINFFFQMMNLCFKISFHNDLRSLIFGVSKSLWKPVSFLHSSSRWCFLYFFSLLQFDEFFLFFSEVAWEDPLST